jgi:hypothetical protein
LATITQRVQIVQAERLALRRHDLHHARGLLPHHEKQIG